VLANEQVEAGRAGVSGALVNGREKLTQWVLQDLLTTPRKRDCAAWVCHSTLINLARRKVKLMQANWIGQSRGPAVCCSLTIDGPRKGHDRIEFYHSTRPDHPAGRLASSGLA